MSTKRFSTDHGTAVADSQGPSFWADSTSVWHGHADSIDRTVSIPFAVDHTSTGWFLLVEGTGSWHNSLTGAVRSVISLAQARAVTIEIAAADEAEDGEDWAALAEQTAAVASEATVTPEQSQQVSDAILALEGVWGTLPSGQYLTVRRTLLGLLATD